MIKNKRGYTLLEVVLAVFIFSVVALPLLNIYLQAVKTDVAARGILNANYIAQDYLEQLDNTSYAQALADLPAKQQTGNYYLSATMTPHGAGSGLFESSRVYAHLLLSEDGKMLAVMPDGKWQLYNAIPAQISIEISGGFYSFAGDDLALTGTSAYNNCVLVINAMKMPQGHAPQVNLGTGCKAVVYCTSANAAFIVLSGEGIKHKDVIRGDKSLVRVTSRVYDSFTATTPIAQSEAYITIRNDVS